MTDIAKEMRDLADEAIVTAPEGRALLRRGAAEIERLTAVQPQRMPARDPMVAAVASLAAAISLLERTPKAKKAAPSDKMFDQMLSDYRKSLKAARAALTRPDDPPQRMLPRELTGEIACILEDCDPPENQTPEAVVALIADYQPTWDRIVAALTRPDCGEEQ